MYESKYSQYITKNSTRFAEVDEIIDSCEEFNPSESKIPAGVPLLYDRNGKMYVDNEDVHSAIIGPSGCKKTRCVIYQTVKTVIAAGESAIITDPKGEIYRNTAHDAKEKGVDVIVLNFRTMLGHQWNPLYQAIKFYNKGEKDIAFQLINDFAQIVISPAVNKNDTYWTDHAQALLNSNALCLMDSLKNNVEYFNIGNIIQMSYEENTAGLKSLIRRMDEMSVASMGYKGALVEADKTRSCIFSTLMSALAPFTKNQKLIDMLSGNSFSIEELGKKQMIVYLIYPDEKSTLNFIINLFLTQCYEILMNVAASYETDRLPIRCNFILDEFANLPKVESFENRISECRSKNIRYVLAFQAFSQLEEKYGKSANTILSNCANWMIFSTKEMALLNMISELCGKEVDYNNIEHPLLTPSEMQHLKKEWEYAQAVLIKQGQYPFVTKLKDIEHIDVMHITTEALGDVVVENNAKYITFDAWLKSINNGILRTPFPSK